LGQQIRKVCKVLVIFAVFLGIPRTGLGQSDTPAELSELERLMPMANNKPEHKWTDVITIRGYTQMRYNRLFETNPDLQCEQCDRSWGGDGGFFFRRIRIIFFGNVHERVYFYIQPDFASSPTEGQQQFAQIRDAYFDLALDAKKEFRFRIGQSKVPFGYENMQSSQNRIPLDRNDAINSAFANERDIGIFFYYAPSHVRQLFADLMRRRLKPSGDYGMFGLGVFNGQTANRPDLNRTLHTVARITYPFTFSNGQIFEPAIQAYTGQLVLRTVTAGVEGEPNFEYLDQRMAFTGVLYTQPFGVTVEYNFGTGPEYVPEKNRIEQRPLQGGFLQLAYRTTKDESTFIPFSRFHYYDGGKKHERDARKHRVRELEVGVEWEPYPNFELVVMYTFSNRVFEDALLPQNHQRGRLLRLQFQLNF
jgi:hypothetical protein